MRFGRDLHKHQTPEWASSYVRYAELKKLSKFAAKATIEQKSNAADLLQKLKVVLRSDIAAVETFYTRQYAILEQRAAVLCNRYDRGASSLFLTSFAINELGPQGAEEVLATCLELRLGFKKLQWYGKVNRDGFSNILGKLRRFLITNVDDCMLYQCEFAGQCRSIEILDRIDKAIVCLDADFSTRSGGAPLVLGTIHNDGFDVEDLPFHRILIRMGQNLSRHIPSTQNVHLEGSEMTPSNDAKDSVALFTDLLDRLLPHQYQSLFHKDVFGRSPLHYASQYGLAEACHIILQRIQVGKAPDGIAFAHTVLSSDSEGYTPLHLAVTNGHTATVRTLLESLHIEDIAIETTIEMDVCTSLAKLIDIALRSNFTEIAKLLLATRNCDVNYQTENGETALFVAARSGREDYVKMLIESPGLHELDLNLSENGYGWTPLIVACVQGNQSVVEILLDAGADQSLYDAFSWTARDHTAFRGFWSIGKLLAAMPPESSARIPKIQLLETNALPPCNADETRIFVNIGTLNTRQPKPAVDMDPYLTRFPYNPYPEIGFSVRISAVGATGSTGLIQLPILNDATNYPYVFTTTDLDRVQLVFSVFKSNFDIQDGEHIGGAAHSLQNSRVG
jgi:glycerophosphodiester phosphodiesterase